MTKLLLIIGTLLATISFVPYIRDILRHGARPRLVSWVIWTLLLGLMAIVSVQEKQWGSALVASISAIGCFAVVVIGYRYASRDVSNLEKVTLMAAVAGIALWFVVENPLVVMIVALLIDGIAYVPTIIHAWQDPEEESLAAYAVAGTGQVLVLSAVWLEHTTLVGLLYPLYASLFSLLMVSLIHISQYVSRESRERAVRSY